jgi:HEAT repeat protein
MRALKRATAIFACFTRLATSVLGAQEPPEASILFREFQSPQKTAQATEQLLKLGKSNTKVKNYLAMRLPPVIEKSPHDNPEVWNNAVRLAGELKIAEAAPTLGKWIGLNTGGSFTFAGFERLENNAPAKALAMIGDPAVPTLNGILEHGDLNEREVAVRTLKLIGSPRARSALRGHLKRESDPNVRDSIEKALAG